MDEMGGGLTMDSCVKLEVLGVAADARLAVWDVLLCLVAGVSCTVSFGLPCLYFVSCDHPLLFCFSSALWNLSLRFYGETWLLHLDDEQLRLFQTYIRRPLAKRPDGLHDVRVLLAADFCVFLADWGPGGGATS